MVRPNRKGFEANKLKNKLAFVPSDTALNLFSDVRVPKEISSERPESDSSSSWSF